MDGAKREKMKDIAWGPAPSCASCVHSRFANKHSQWGVCALSENQYKHGKHDRMHDMPAHISAVCDKYKQGDLVHELRAWMDSEITS